MKTLMDVAQTLLFMNGKERHTINTVLWNHIQVSHSGGVVTCSLGLVCMALEELVLGSILVGK
jgi:hypothetical protein